MGTNIWRHRNPSGRIDPGSVMPLLAMLFVTTLLGTTTSWAAAFAVGPGGFALGCIVGWFAHAWNALSGTQGEQAHDRTRPRR